MKKILIFAVLALAISACAPAIHAMGGYTQEEYITQTTQINVQATQISDLKTELAKNDAAVKVAAIQVSDLKDQVDQLKGERLQLMTDLDNYKDVVCAERNWDELNNARVYELSYGNADLIQIERDTGVKFYLTQWVPFGEPDMEGTGFWVLTVDNFNGIALDAKDKCVVLDPDRWPDVAR